MMKRIIVFCVLFFGGGMSSVDRAVADGVVPIFEDGDRVCFVGDSITHGGSYHSVVYLYYLTRFPKREIRVFNAGVSGDTAQKTLSRFEGDVAAKEPTVSAVMLGMNDVGRSFYEEGKSELDDDPRKQDALRNYYRNMDALVARLGAIGSEVILITPSIYDQTAEIGGGNNLGGNDAPCAEYVKKTVVAAGKGVVDFYDAMCTINADVQRTDSSATIVGADRVHPLPDPGHFIMGYQFLKAQGVPQVVSKTGVNAQEGTLEVAENCSITALEAKPDFVSFTSLEAALPFPQTEAIAKGLALVPFTQEMNQETLFVKNLAEGSYSLIIDGVAVGSYSSGQLAKGINLALNKNTPQVKQALNVRILNNERHALQLKLRNYAYTRYNGLASFSGDFRDAVAVETVLAEQLQRVEGKPWYGYVKKCYAEYVELLPHVDQISADLEGLHAKLYQANQPVPHRFVIERGGFQTLEN